jgi:hypothetical protein
MNIIFLDIDGVLNSVESTIAYHHLRGHPTTIFSEADRLDPITIGLLKCLVDATDAKIVISSTWRINYSLEELIAIFATHEWENAPLIGKTGRGGVGTVRGDEIQEWLNAHPEVTNYVIVDDDSDMLDEHRLHFVNTSGTTGFTLVNLCEALTIFGVPNKDFEAHAYFAKP